MPSGATAAKAQCGSSPAEWLSALGASAVLSEGGTWSVAPHLGHLACLPAASGGALHFFRHWGHLKRIMGGILGRRRFIPCLSWTGWRRHIVARSSAGAQPKNAIPFVVWLTAKRLTPSAGIAVARMRNGHGRAGWQD